VEPTPLPTVTPTPIDWTAVGALAQVASAVVSLLAVLASVLPIRYVVQQIKIAEQQIEQMRRGREYSAATYLVPHYIEGESEGDGAKTMGQALRCTAATSTICPWTRHTEVACSTSEPAIARRTLT
jgi:hypothetical protein